MLSVFVTISIQCMNTIYKNYKKPVGAKPGYSPNAFIAPLSWFAEIQEPVASTPTQLVGDKFTIATSHTFLEDKGAIAVYCAPKSVEGAGEIVGEQLAKRFRWTPKIIIPGDSAALLELIDGVLNEPVLLFLKGAECGTTGYIQFGCDCDPAVFDAGSFASGTSAEGRKQYELTMEAFCKFFYNGTITELED